MLLLRSFAIDCFTWFYSLLFLLVLALSLLFCLHFHSFHWAECRQHRLSLCTTPRVECVWHSTLFVCVCVCMALWVSIISVSEGGHTSFSNRRRKFHVESCVVLEGMSDRRGRANRLGLAIFSLMFYWLVYVLFLSWTIRFCRLFWDQNPISRFYFLNALLFVFIKKQNKQLIFVFSYILRIWSLRWSIHVWWLSESPLSSCSNVGENNWPIQFVLEFGSNILLNTNSSLLPNYKND